MRPVRSNVFVLAIDDLRDLLRVELERALGQRGVTDGYLSLKSAAAFLDISEHALRARVKRGEIPVHRRDGRLYFARQELNDYVMRRI